MFDGSIKYYNLIMFYNMKNNCLPRDEYLVFDFVGSQFAVVSEQISITPSSWPTAIDLSDDHIFVRTKIHIPFHRILVESQIWSGAGITIHI